MPRLPRFSLCGLETSRYLALNSDPSRSGWHSSCIAVESRGGNLRNDKGRGKVALWCESTLRRKRSGRPTSRLTSHWKISSRKLLSGRPKAPAMKPTPMMPAPPFWATALASQQFFTKRSQWTLTIHSVRLHQPQTNRRSIRL